MKPIFTVRVASYHSAPAHSAETAFTAASCRSGGYPDLKTELLGGKKMGDVTYNKCHLDGYQPTRLLDGKE
jgi:hypothetical protein